MKTALSWGSVVVLAAGCAVEIIYTQDVGWIAFFAIACGFALHEAMSLEN